MRARGKIIEKFQRGMIRIFAAGDAWFAGLGMGSRNAA
jgi:hypothetical protein